MFRNLEGPLTVELYGPWKSEINKLTRAGYNIRQGALIGQRKAGTRLEKLVKSHLQNQDLGIKKLTEKYLKRKTGAGLNSGILVSTGAYLEAIDTWQENYTQYVGVRRGKLDRTAYYKSGGKRRIEIAEVATINELGNALGRPPRRPLWATSLKELGGVKGIRDIVTQSIYTNLRNKGYNVDWT